MTFEHMTDQPLFGEIRHRYVEGRIEQSIWNGKKWLDYDEIYPIIHYALTGEIVNDGEKKPGKPG